MAHILLQAQTITKRLNIFNDYGFDTLINIISDDKQLLKDIENYIAEKTNL